MTEANAMGTPAVGYDIPGLRDSIRHGKTGILTDNKPEQLAKAAVELLTTSELLRKCAKRALELSRQFSWETSVNSVELLLKEKAR